MTRGGARYCTINLEQLARLIKMEAHAAFTVVRVIALDLHHPWSNSL